MRNNQPVTNNEYAFPSHQRLISSTDTRGVIRYFNHAFLTVSGFSEEELMGSPHNIVRHPDMLSAVYEDMWATLKSGMPWMGLVKNRRKDGDYYWVSAYITPIIVNKKITGFESVRVLPTEKQKQRAESVYARMRAGKRPHSRTHVIKQFLNSQIGIWLPTITAAAVASFWLGTSAALLILLTGLAAMIISGIAAEKAWHRLLKIMPDGFHNKLVSRTYSAAVGAKALAEMMILSELARSHTGLTRIHDSTEQLYARVTESREQAEESHSLSERQGQAMTTVASAIHEMSTSIQEVANNVESNSEESDEVVGRVDTSAATEQQALVAI